eukprot:6181051-Pleurochrysis_carterae.AAC.1
MHQEAAGPHITFVIVNNLTIMFGHLKSRELRHSPISPAGPAPCPRGHSESSYEHRHTISAPIWANNIDNKEGWTNGAKRQGQQRGPKNCLCDAESNVRGARREEHEKSPRGELGSWAESTKVACGHLELLVPRRRDSNFVGNVNDQVRVIHGGYLHLDIARCCTCKRALSSALVIVMKPFVN